MNRLISTLTVCFVLLLTLSPEVCSAQETLRSAPVERWDTANTATAMAAGFGGSAIGVITSFLIALPIAASVCEERTDASDNCFSGILLIAGGGISIAGLWIGSTIGVELYGSDYTFSNPGPMFGGLAGTLSALLLGVLVCGSHYESTACISTFVAGGLVLPPIGAALGASFSVVDPNKSKGLSWQMSPSGGPTVDGEGWIVQINLSGAHF